jgi:hypothetical protein
MEPSDRAKALLAVMLDAIANHDGKRPMWDEAMEADIHSIVDLIVDASVERAFLRLSNAMSGAGRT